MMVLLQKLFGVTFEDIMGNSRKLHNDVHHNMCTCYLLWCKTKEEEMCGACDIYIYIYIYIYIPDLSCPFKFLARRP